MADPNLSEIITTTLRKRQKKLADNVSNGVATLSYLSANGRVKNVDGGRTIVEELDYQENSTFKYYSGYEALNISAVSVLSAAEFNWKQAAVVITASGLEIEVQNSGVEAIINLLEARERNAMRTMSNNLGTGILSDGTGTSSKQITGLAATAPSDPTTGTYGSIDRASFSFWRSQLWDFSTESVTASKTTIQQAMQTLALRCQRGNDRTNFIVFGSTYFQYFWESLTDIQRITSPAKGVAGFETLVFRNNVPVVYDEGMTAALGYFLNTDYLAWRPHTRRNMVPLMRREGVDQDAIVIPIVFAGNLTCSNSDLQGRMQA